MVKSIKYIIKRIIIGVGIALALMFIKGSLIADVFANEISPYQWGGYSYTITSNTTNFNFNVPSLPGGGQPWFNHNNGILRFNLSINKLTGDNTQAFPMPRTIVATSGNNRFVCSFGNTQWQNSTFVGVTYSVECPMNLYNNNGVDSVLIAFSPTGMPVNNTYNMTISSDASFELYEELQVNVTTDTSSTTNAINNQITNDNSNTQNIINNQEQNTQDIIDSNKVCKIIDKSNIVLENKGLIASNGVVLNYNGWGVTNYISISSSDELISFRRPDNNYVGYCFYDSNKTLISCSALNTIVTNTPFVIPSDTSYFRTTIYMSSNSPVFKLCRNGNQVIADGQQQINDTLNDDSGVPDSDLSDLFGDFEQSDTPISDLLTMPLTLIQAYIDGMSGTCQSIVLGRLYGENLFIPCINLEEYLGSDLWSTIDILISLFMIYNLSQLLIFAFDGITSLDDNFQSLYGPRHAGPPQSRVERNSDLY